MVLIESINPVPKASTAGFLITYSPAVKLVGTLSIPPGPSTTPPIFFPGISSGGGVFGSSFDSTGGGSCPPAPGGGSSSGEFGSTLSSF